VETAKSTAKKMAKLSESAGTPFTAEEYLQSVAESSEEMSAEQLQRVSGGREMPIGQMIVDSIALLGIGCVAIGIVSLVDSNAKIGPCGT
jgi:hypothetical protein